MEKTNNTVEKPSGKKHNSSLAEENNKGKEEIDEEDVPGDFFDDFLKEDFMAGLDIVDDDEWDEEKNKTDSEKKNSTNVSEVSMEISKKKKKQKSDKIDHGERLRKTSNEKRNKRKEEKKEKRESKEKKLTRKLNKDNSREKVIDADEFDIRRDPIKTKRDIERDKAKCEKDKEKRIISEKLSLVETGLVPPGMEMEIDIEEIKKQRVLVELNKPQRDLREHLNQKKLKSKSKSPNRRLRSPKRRSPLRRSVSPLRRSPKRRRSRSPRREKSPIRKSPGRKSPKRSPLQVGSNSQKRSPLRRSLPRRSPLPSRRSPLISRRSPLISRRSPERRSHERMFGGSNLRRSRSKSPYYKSQRHRYSPNRRGRSSSRVSDREVWLRRRRRSRSRSPRRKRDEKKSFLQEIAEKLNETRPPPINIVQPLGPQMHFLPQPLGQPLSQSMGQPLLQPMGQPMPQPIGQPMPQPMGRPMGQPMPQPRGQPIGHPMPQPIGQPMPQSIHNATSAPTPVPPPNPTHIPTQTERKSQTSFDQYDQSFFIGTQQNMVSSSLTGQIQVERPKTTPVNFSQSQIPLNPLSINSVKTQLPTTTSTLVKNDESKLQTQAKEKLDGKEDLAKLFHDKKITLSEFLAITAKPEVNSTSPVHLREKIKVITRCQEALKFLESGEKKYFGKFIVRPTNNYKVLEKKYISPLLKAPAVVFPFTQIPQRWEQKANFTSFINRLLQTIGLMKEVVVDVEGDNIPSTEKPGSVKHASPPPPPPPPVIQQRKFPHNETKSPKSPRFNNRALNMERVSKNIQTDVFKCESCEKRKKILYKTTGIQHGEPISFFSVSTQVTEEDFYPKAKPQSLASLTPAQLLGHSRASGEPQGSRFGRLSEKELFDFAPNFNRANFPSFDNYGPLRPRPVSPPQLLFNPPAPREEQFKPSIFDAFMSNSVRGQIPGGSGRGRENPPSLFRNLDSNRSNYYNYY